MPCGPGRYALEFAHRGFQVTGADLNPSFIAQAREFSQKEGLSIEFLQEEMRKFRREHFYDVGLNISSSFKVLENFFPFRPGGFVLAEEPRS